MTPLEPMLLAAGIRVGEPRVEELACSYAFIVGDVILFSTGFLIGLFSARFL